MKNLFLVLYLISFISTQANAADPLYDTRGDEGRKAIDGRDGSGAGGDGENAMAPTDAQDSGEIKLDITEVKNEKGEVKFQISAEMRNADGTIKDKYEHLFDVDKNGLIITDHTGLTQHAGSIVLDSSGTDADDGGNGGSGKKGATGRRGSDATRWSHGTDGGAGERGGDAGAGTDSAQSGDAAKSTVNIAEDQTHLLMHIDEIATPGVLNGVIPGGRATRAGTHGKAGAGGDGGAGGSSHTWTTTTTHTRSVSDGNGGTRTETYTKTHFHHNPGGSRGPTGPKGREQTSVLRGRSKGRDAAFVINVKRADGETLSYNQGRFDLEIVEDAKYKSAAAYQGIVDGIIEPDEMVEVAYKVKNTSGMPTPKRVAHLAVLDSQGVRRTDVTREVEIPALKPGETFVTDPQYVRASSMIKLPVKGDAIVERGILTPEVTQSGTGGAGKDKVYNRANRKTGFEIQQAVRLDNELDIRGTTSLVPDLEETWIEIDVINNSQTNAIGRKAEIPRQLSTRQQFIEVDGIGPDDIQVEDENGRTVNLAKEIETEHKRLGPGEKKTLKLKLKIKEGTKPYTSGELLTTLNRGPLGKLLKKEDIQVQGVKVQAVKTFNPNSATDVVLITNGDTPIEAVEAYKIQLKSNYGLEVEDYNISYYSALDIEKPPLSKMQNKNVTFMVLNNEYGAENNRAANRFKLDQTLKAIHDKKYTVMFLGPGSPGSDLSARLSPADTPFEKLKTKKYESKGEFDNKYEKAGTSVNEIKPGTADQVQVRERFVATQTTDKKLKKQAAMQVAKLNELDPQGRYMVITTPGNDGSQPKTHWWDEFKRRVSNFFTNRPVGSYTIMRTSDINDAGVSHLKVDKSTMSDPKFVKSYDFNLAFLKQLPFELKLRLVNEIPEYFFEKMLARDDKPLYNAILSDLAEEQALVRKSGKGQLKKLQKLTEFNFRGDTRGKDSVKMRYMSNLIADVVHMSKQSKTGAFDNVSKRSIKLVDQFMKGISRYESDHQQKKIIKVFKKMVKDKVKFSEAELAKLRTENKATVKAARRARFEKLPFYKKPFSGFMSDPELDANGNVLQDSLHDVETKTFLLTANEAKGYGLDTGRNIIPENFVTDEDMYRYAQQTRADYNQRVDEKVTFEQVERAKNTGKDERYVYDVHPHNPVDHDLECPGRILRKISK